MASANSLRCLARPSIAPRIHPIIRSTASFSTSQAVTAASAPATASKTAPQKKTYKRERVVVPIKKPGPGERRAFRKRIQLSNNSALPVPGLSTLNAETMALEESAGQMFAIPDALADQLRSLEAFKTTQTWNLFRSPHFLVREETVGLINKLQDSVAKKEGLKCVLTGTKLSGKSMALLQAMSYALLNKWIVVHIPEGTSLIFAQDAITHTSQAKILQSDNRTTPLSRTRTLSNSLSRRTASSYSRASTRPTRQCWSH